MNGETAQARRFYHHVASGASLSVSDVGGMVEYIERRDAEIERLRRLLSVNGATCDECGAEAYDLDGSEWAKCKAHLNEDLK